MPPPRRRTLLPLTVTVVGVAVLLGLGTWQLQRRTWKHELIATMQARLTAPPVPLPAVIDNPGDWEYRPVTVSGRFAAGRDGLRIARPREGRAGYQLLTPLLRDDGGAAVLIDRGFVPLTWQNPAARTLPAVDTAVGITGVARSLPTDMPDTADLAPLLIEALPAGALSPTAYPRPDPPRTPDLPDNHLSYAMTWYALAVGLLAVYVIDRRRSRSQPPIPP